MTCYSPCEGFRGPGGSWVASRSKSGSKVPLNVPCGRCIGCRMDRARDWGVRIEHEASLHECSSFLTLTYRDEDLPDDYSVAVRPVQLFLKRLRKRVEPERVRFYACGEYGDRDNRPHYHLILFGFDFPDKAIWRRAPSGAYTYRSAVLESLWPFGHAEIGSVTKQSGAYVARYCLKKVSGPPSLDHYRRIHPGTGELVSVRPEFAVMSTRPGIGFGWFSRFESDAFPSGFVVIDGEKLPVPRYYKNRLRGRNIDLEDWLAEDDLKRTGLAAKGRKFMREHKDDNTPERLAARQELASLKQEAFVRDLGVKE